MKETATQLARLHELRLQGYSDEELQTALRVDSRGLARLQDALIDQQAEAVSGETAKRTYARYSIEQRVNIKALDLLITNLDRGRQYNALVGAIKVRAELTDKLLVRGQELGILHKVADAKGQGGGSVTNNTLVIGGLSRKEIGQKIGGIAREFKELTSAYSAQDMAELPVGELYSGEGIAEEEEGEGMGTEVVSVLTPRRRRKKKPIASKRKVAG